MIFSPAFTVHSFYRRAILSGLWDKILQHMVKVIRKNAGLEENPSVALLDSQSVQNSSVSEQSDKIGGLLAVVTHKANQNIRR